MFTGDILSNTWGHLLQSNSNTAHLLLKRYMLFCNQLNYISSTLPLISPTPAVFFLLCVTLCCNILKAVRNVKLVY